MRPCSNDLGHPIGWPKSFSAEHSDRQGKSQPTAVGLGDPFSACLGMCTAWPTQGSRANTVGHQHLLAGQAAQRPWNCGVRFSR
jgi:hypothetical protein